MQFLKNIFGNTKLDGAALAASADLKEYAQIALLAHFLTPQPLHDATLQGRWSRVLPRPYADTIAIFEKQGWLEATAAGYQVTPVGRPFAEAYVQRAAREESNARQQVRVALGQMMTSEALTIRRQYENRMPLGKAPWTGPEPQMNHSAVTRRIFFLDNQLLGGLSPETAQWLKLYAAEQHLWGVHWTLDAATIPADVAAELARPDMQIEEAVYWRGYALSLFVDNQDTWQRVKGGDHVRRLEIVGPDDEHTCSHCRSFLGKQFLVVRVPDLPHPECTSQRGCRCRYEPVLEVLEEIPLV